MKVLMINSVCGIRSTGRICTDIADALTAQGHEVKIAYGRETVPEKYQHYAVKIGSELDVKIHGIQARLFDGMGFGSKRATEKFIAWVKEYDPDVIHLHNLHGYYINIEVLFRYLKTCSKKILWTLHDCWAFTGHCAHFDYAQCNRWVEGCHHCPQKAEYPATLLADRAKENHQMKKQLFTNVPNMTVIPVSEWLASVVQKSFLHQYPSVVIQNGIDHSAFKPISSDILRQYGIADKRIILGVASLWSPRKGLQHFMELAGMLSEEYRIVLIGCNEVQISRLPENIIGIKETSSVEELAKWYTVADVFVNPSAEETFGLVTVEAMACGTPVIVFNKTAVPEVVTEQCGVVCAENNAYSIKRELDRLKDYDSCACIEVSKKYQKDVQYQKYIDLMVK